MRYFLLLFLLVSTTASAVTFKWLPPTQRENGEALSISELGGYEIRYRAATENTYHSVIINSGATTQYITQFPSNSNYTVFQIAAFDTNQLYSNFVNLTPNYIIVAPSPPGSPVSASLDILVCPAPSSSSSSATSIASSSSSSSSSLASSSSSSSTSSRVSNSSSSSYLTVPYAAKTVPARLVPGISGKYYVYKAANFGNVSFVNLTQLNSSIATLQPEASFLATNFQYAGPTSSGLAGNVSYIKAFLKADGESLDKVPTAIGDAGYIRFLGMIKLTAGQYAFKIAADDGYSIRINQKVVAEFNNVQSVTTRDHPIFNILVTGYYPIDIKYWDAGGFSSLDIKLANKADNVYTVLNKDILFNF